MIILSCLASGRSRVAHHLHVTMPCQVTGRLSNLRTFRSVTESLGSVVPSVRPSHPLTSVSSPEVVRLNRSGAAPSSLGLLVRPVRSDCSGLQPFRSFGCHSLDSRLSHRGGCLALVTPGVRISDLGKTKVGRELNPCLPSRCVSVVGYFFSAFNSSTEIPRTAAAAASFFSSLSAACSLLSM